MNLEITCYNNLYKVSGVLDRRSISLFQKEFRKIFDKVNSLTLSIEELESIDRYGVMELTRLHNESITQNKKFAIIGRGNKDLYEEFNKV
ncbi:MAG TPA: hypothetical protein VKZ97_06330 [Flavobacteriaceae bacterium]|nr:hypothetical protein [Flavobacteriaceae bacterium]